MTKFRLMAEKPRLTLAEKLTTGSLYWKIMLPIWAAAFVAGWYLGGLLH